jgi:hypothetical protein
MPLKDLVPDDGQVFTQVGAANPKIDLSSDFSSAYIPE